MRKTIGYVDATISFSTPYDVGEKVAGILMFDNSETIDDGRLLHNDFFLEAEVVEEKEGEGGSIKLRIPKECMKLIKEKTGTLAILSN